MAVKAQDITADTLHDTVQNLRGWSIRGDGTMVLRLRRGGVAGQILATLEGSSTEMFDEPIDAQGGTYVEVVAVTFTEGVLYHV